MANKNHKTAKKSKYTPAQQAGIYAKKAIYAMRDGKPAVAANNAKKAALFAKKSGRKFDFI